MSGEQQTGGRAPDAVHSCCVVVQRAEVGGETDCCKSSAAVRVCARGRAGINAGHPWVCRRPQRHRAL